MHIGVCSWSLQPTSPTDLAEKIRAAGLTSVQLALDPLRTGAMDETETVARLADAGITICSGMMAMKGEDYSTLDSIRRTGGLRPDETWAENLDAAKANADLAARLGISLVTFHAGFLPHEAGDPERPKLIERLRTLADVYSARGVRVGFETGQETAETLLGVLAELAHDAVGVNFDPANMVLYGMGDPVEAMEHLAAHIVQIHIKDALPTKTPGEWGSETPAGEGAVDWPSFFACVKKHGLDVDLMIEREAGGRRIEDIAKARALAERLA